MSFNHKDERIRKLWDKGIRDYPALAKKIGYGGGATDKGIERVKEGLKRMELI